ncbi:MAG TPA: nicotinate-nucleotide adenylyltransferase [Blastocatellia bacterium]|nr:nicotinate-nucleotide adenylyltransferase [Blastocatellia bacterium]
MRIGAYGGTFDPIHNGHLDVARAVTRRFGLDALLLIPAHRPPHKEPNSLSGAYHRYAMAALATMDEPRIRVSTIEVEAPERPYTFQTMERLRGVYGPEASLYFVMGADSYEELNTWREPGRLLAAANLIVAARPGYEISSSHLPVEFQERVVDLRGRGELSDDADAGLKGAPACSIFLTDYVRQDISSTEIRRRAREGEHFRELVPPQVADYVDKYNLYRR